MANLGYLKHRAYFVPNLGDGLTGLPTRDIAADITYLRWERNFRRTSRATVRFDTAGCCDVIREVDELTHLLVIETQQGIAWRGTVVTVGDAPGQVSVTAADSTWWFAGRSLTDSGMVWASGVGDIGDLAAQVLDLAFLGRDPGTLANSTGGLVGSALASDIGPDEMAGDEWSRLTSAGLDWTVVGGQLIYGRYQVVIPALSDLDFVEGLTAVTRGDLFATDVVLQGDGVVGRASVASPLPAHLRRTVTVPNDSVSDQVGADRAAAAELGERYPSPVVLSAPTGALLPSAGLTLEDLVPGGVTLASTSRLCRDVSGSFRLDSVVVEQRSSDAGLQDASVSVVFVEEGVVL